MWSKFPFPQICLCLFLFLIASIAPRIACAQPVNDTLVINNDKGEYPLNQHFYIYKTDTRVTPAFVYDTIKAKDILRLFPEKAYSDKFTVSKYYWLFFTVKNNLSHDGTFYCQLNSNLLNVVHAYKKNKGAGFTYLGISGCDVPFRAKAYQYYDIVFPIILKTGETTTIIMLVDGLNGEDIHFLPQLRSVDIFKAEEERFYVVTGLITGLMLTVFVLNIFLAISLKEKFHFLYALYILVVTYCIWGIHGLDIQYIYPDHPKISVEIEYLPFIALGVLMTYIMQWFLNQKKENSKVKRYVDISLWALVAMAPINGIIYFIFPSNTYLMGIYENVLLLICFMQCLLCVASAVEKAIQKYKPAWFYLAAVLFFIAGLIEYLLMMFVGKNQENMLKQYPNNIEIGFIVETIVVFFGIVYRYNLFKQEKEKLMGDLNIHQQNLIKKIISAEEAERKRIAEDLHDDVGASLSILSMHISNAQQFLKNTTDFEVYNNQSLALSNKVVDDVRNIAHNLLPKDFTDLGLFLTLENRIYQLNSSGPIRFTLVTEGDESKLNDVLAITIYRIINELLTNICKHSVAANAAVQVLIEDEGIQIMAEDDGIGFNNKSVANGIGLKNIKGRVDFLKGSINIDNQNGTQTIIYIPL